MIIKIEDSNLLMPTVWFGRATEKLFLLQPRYQTLSQHQYQAFSKQLKSTLVFVVMVFYVSSPVPEANELAYMVNVKRL